MFRLLVDLGLPVVDFVLFRYREVALDAALGVEELNFRAPFDEAVGDLKFRLKLPSRHALLLYSQKLRKGYVGLNGFGRICLHKSCRG